MGCTGSKPESLQEEPSAKNRGRNRSRHFNSGSPSRDERIPPKPIKREDALSHNRSSESATKPAGCSYHTVNEPARQKAAAGTGVSIEPPTGFPGYVSDRLLPVNRSRDERGRRCQVLTVPQNHQTGLRARLVRVALLPAYRRPGTEWRIGLLIVATWETCRKLQWTRALLLT
jgi:hypothetical protein